MSNPCRIDPFDKGVTSRRSIPDKEQKKQQKYIIFEPSLSDSGAPEGLSPDKNVPEKSRQTGANKGGKVGEG